MLNAIVTGGAAGIGRGIALRLAQEGYRVFIIDMNETLGKQTEKDINDTNREAHFLKADLTDSDHYSELIRNIYDQFGSLSVLVNNAGGVGEDCFPDVATEKWSHVIDLNLKSVMQGIQSSLETMDDGGDIVNISSLAGVGTEPHDAPEYAASKAAVMRLTSSLTDTLNQRKVKINTICPGWVDTPASQKTRENMDPEEIPKHLLKPIDIAEKVLQFIRSHRTGVVMVWKEDELPYEIV